ARRRLVGLYRRIGRTYWAWARVLLPLAVVVFVPLGLVHAIPVHVEATSFDLDNGIKVFGAALALLMLTASGLLGEIFYTGAVAIALTHPRGDEPPSLREVARTVDYRTLIVVDLIFGLLVALGFVALVVPGVLAFVYLSLAAPAVEIEHRGVGAALARSARLVRGRFWYVLAALVPIELGSDAFGSAATHVVYGLFGDSLIAAWLTDTTSNILLTPIYAVAAVLLTLDLIAEKDGDSPRLHSTPVSK
ncbi:MAG TPA: hypothetical protein VFT10_02695, partial [Solirubrobacterales bacterium]|nr:hypothetical protein [Solirubrobacterales bacterium]